MTRATTRTNIFAHSLTGPKLATNIQTTFLLVDMPVVDMIAAAICRLLPRQDMCNLKMLYLRKYTEQC